MKKSYYIKLMIINKKQIISCLLLGFFSLMSYGQQAKKISDSVESLTINETLNLARANFNKDFDKALKYALSAEKKAKEENNITILYEIYQAIGYSYEHNNVLDKSLLYYNRALEIANTLDDDFLKLKIYTDLAIVNRRLANFDLSKTYHLKTLEIAIEIDDQKSIENSYHGLGSFYEAVGDYKNAIQNYLTAIQLTEERGDKPNVVNSMQYLAITYAAANQPEIALKTIEKANTMALEVNDSFLIGIVLFDYGKILNSQQKYDDALSKFHQSLSTFQDIQHKPLIARSLLYLADTYVQRKDFENAFEYFNACQQYEPFISLKGQADLNHKLGNLYAQQNDNETAKNYFNKSLAIAQRQGFKVFCQKNNYELYKIYNTENNDKKALEYLMNYNEFRDSLVNEESAKAIRELEFKYEVERQERQIQSLQLSKNRTMFWSAFVVFSILLSSLGYITYITRKNNRKLKSKNEEIERKNIELKESNEVLTQFSYVAAHDLKEPLRNIGSFINLLQLRYGKELGEEATEYMTYVLSGVKRMNSLLSALLNYSTVSFQKPVTNVVDTNDVMDEVIQNLHYSILNTKATIECNGALPQVFVGRLHLMQLFQNIISNAIKFSEVRPMIKIDGVVRDNETIFSVVDNAIGIDMVHGNKPFRLFYQIDKSKEGTGIGLTVCKNIMDKYNGRIWYENNQTNGSTIYFAFPNQEKN